MNKYPSPIILTAFAMICITAGILIAYFGEKYDNRTVFSSSSVPVPAAQAGPGHTMRVSAYCPGSCCCGKWADGYTSSGVPAVGLIVAAPSTIPFGTVLDIPGYGVASVQDRGGAITGDRLDVLFTDKDGISGHQQALNWGVRNLYVKVIK